MASTATPSLLIRSSKRNRSLTIRGARPSESSSQMRRDGFAIRARPTATICCSPPESSPACRCRSGANCGNRSNTSEMVSLIPETSFLDAAPHRRFSSVVRCGKSIRPSGTWATPLLTMVRLFCLVISWSPNLMDPEVHLPFCRYRTPVMVRTRVVFPAPLDPSTETKPPAGTSMEIFRSAGIGP